MTARNTRSTSTSTSRNRSEARAKHTRKRGRARAERRGGKPGWKTAFQGGKISSGSSARRHPDVIAPVGEERIG